MSLGQQQRVRRILMSHRELATVKDAENTIAVEVNSTNIILPYTHIAPLVLPIPI